MNLVPPGIPTAVLCYRLLCKASILQVSLFQAGGEGRGRGRPRKDAPPPKKDAASTEEEQDEDEDEEGSDQ